MAIISISDLTFAYDGSYDNVFEGVSLTLDTDWRLGLVGRNGRGKTTLLSLLMGKYEYSGSIAASVDFEYFPYAVEDMSAQAMDVAYSICPTLEYWELCRELSRLELPDERLFQTYGTLSPGERTKLMLAAMFLRENSFLLIDEPTNNLDARGRQLAADYLRGKKGYILVSHDRAFLDGCVDHIMSINRADIEVRKGDFSAWYADRMATDRRELAENRRLKKEIAALERSARQAAQWSERLEDTKKSTRIAGLRPDRGAIGAQAARMMKRSKNIEARREAAAEEKSELLHNIEKLDDLRLSPVTHHAKRLVWAEELSIAYGEREILSGVRLCIEQGQRVALCGRNGCGKSSIFRAIEGQVRGELPEGMRCGGRLQTASGLVLSVVSQDTSGLAGDLGDYAQRCGVDESLFKAILRKLEFPRHVFERDMSTFSAGQKKKVLIARSLCERAHLYLWDEPLNYIDVFSRMQIEEMLRQGGFTMLFVEHDQAFCDNVANAEIRIQ